MFKHAAAIAASALVLSAVAVHAQSITLDGSVSVPASVPKQPISMDLTAIDKTADPCVSFYDYACGNWRKNNPIPADKTRWGRFDQLAEYNTYLLYEEAKAAAEKPATPLQKKYGDYFAACMNVTLADKLGTAPLKPQFDAIATWKDKKALAGMLGEHEARHGSSFLINFGSEQDQKDSTLQIGALFQGGLSLPDRDYYLQQDDRMKKIREQYLEHVTKMFVLLGDTPQQATTEAAAVMKIETALAEGSTPRVELRDPHNVYHVMTQADLQTLTPGFQWKAFFDGLHFRVLPTVNVATPNYFKAMDAEIQAASVEEWRSYLRWHVLHSSAGALSQPFDDENFRFFGQVLTGQKEKAPRWRRCTQATDHSLGEALGQEYVKEHFPPVAKQNMKQLVSALETSMGEDLKSLDWMSAATKEQALRKLTAFRDKIGYPETWRDYSALEIKRDDPDGNYDRAAVFSDRYDLNKIGKPVDEKEWQMTPPTVNAYYDPSMNDINFPAGILQPPFFDFKMDAAANFGAIGVVIGHEMTHAFDDEGSQYDEHGNVREWWTPEDKKAFDTRTDCEVQEYGSFESVPGAKLNGKLTLGENTADNGGLRIAYAALQSVLAKDPSAAKPIDGYTPDQRFFLGFAQVWCENVREETARMRVKTDPHSPGRYRTNGTVQNFDQFGKAFSCHAGQPMVPASSCRVW